MSIGSRSAYWFVAPAIILMGLIFFIPVLMALGLGFTNYSLGNSGFEFVALENFEKIFTRRSYEKMWGATLTYVLVVVPLSVLLGLAAALAINSVTRFRDVYKTIYFLPVMATLMAMAIVWQIMLHPTAGVINRTLASGCDAEFVYGVLSGAYFGFDPLTTWYGNACANVMPNWLGDKKYAIWVICFIGVWQNFGFNMVLYLAGLTSVSRELYMAAQMDGARSAWDRFRLVTWPALGPTTVFVVTISTIRGFQVFDIVEAFYGFGSAGPGKSAYVMMFAIFEKGIKQNLIGIGSAITIIFLIFVMFITLVQRYLVERKVHYS